MAYLREWERLSDAVVRLVEQAGLPKQEAQDDIRRAVADRATKIRGKLGRHAIKPSTASDVLEGTAFEIPEDLTPQDLDWEKSRPVKPWPVRRGSFSIPGYWHLEWIELFRADVTSALCSAGKGGVPARKALRETSTRSRRAPALERARAAIQALYHGNVPDQAAEPNVKLCRRVGEMLKADGLPDVSDDTILRAAGRRRN
jgi:hypothetical protein